MPALILKITITDDHLSSTEIAARQQEE